MNIWHPLSVFPQKFILKQDVRRLDCIGTLLEGAFWNYKMKTGQFVWASSLRAHRGIKARKLYIDILIRNN